MLNITGKILCAAMALGMVMSAADMQRANAKGGTHTPSNTAPAPCKYMTSGTPEYVQCVADWKKTPPPSN